MVEHLVVVVGILEADVLEADGTRTGLQRLCVLGILDGHGGIHDLRKALDAGHAALELLGELDDAADGGDEGGDVEHISHQVTGGYPAVHQRQTARKVTTRYIRPSKRRVEVLNAAMA